MMYRHVYVCVDAFLLFEIVCACVVLFNVLLMCLVCVRVRFVSAYLPVVCCGLCLCLNMVLCLCPMRVS